MPKLTDEQFALLKDRCRIVYYPTNGSYPIEYTPFTKDSEFRWQLLVGQLTIDANKSSASQT